MSRQSVAPQRALTLTEELEKLEQSITLTLQEIDHNFSRAHRIVTTNILPVVEQYGRHSEAVWEGSKFWKQFFEASANVSLSGYEEPQPEDETTQEVTHDSQAYDDEQTMEGETVTGATVTPPRPSSAQADGHLEGSSILDSPSLAAAHSTPRAPRTEDEPSFAEYPSPYEALKREMEHTSRTIDEEPRTPAKTHNLPDMSMTPESSPFMAPTTSKKTTQANLDPVLHRVLDKTYRVQATPLTTRKQQKAAVGFTPRTADKTRRNLLFTDDSSPPSSPAPQLRADIFSPVKGPRTPGVSVQTPGRGKQPVTTTKTGAIFDSDSEGEEDDIDFSPPKTMQFHIPQSKLLQTPAREASKRIVEDLLLTAGGDITDDLDGEEEPSPSVVRNQRVDLDDSF